MVVALVFVLVVCSLFLDNVVVNVNVNDVV